MDLRWAWLTLQEWFDSKRPGYEVGVALSGGGIRSATFSLGVLRAMSRAGVLHRVDYLSTVSGGGYAGAFYRSLFVPTPMRGANAALESEKVEEWCMARATSLGADPLGSNIGRSAVEQLRQGGSFLSPNGPSDNLYAALIAVRNWAAVALVTGVALLGLFLLVQLPRAALPWPSVRNLHEAVLTTRSAASPKVIAAESCSVEMRNVEGDLRLRCRKAAAYAPRPQAAARTTGPLLGASWLWFAALVLVPLWTGPVAWGYWLTRNGSRVPRRRLLRLLSGTTGIAILLAVVGALGVRFAGRADLTALAFGLLGASGAGAPLAYAAALWRNSREEDVDVQDRPRSDDAAAILAQENRIRTKLSRWLLKGTQAVLLLAALALADDMGRIIYHLLLGDLPTGSDRLSAAVFGSASVALIPAVRWLLKRMDKGSLPDWPLIAALVRRFAQALSLAIGVFLLGALLSAWSALSYALVWHGAPVATNGAATTWGTPEGMGWLNPAILAGLALLVALTLGRFHGFLNQSSLAFFYAGRLRKAYLGASNVERIAGGTAPDLELANDEIELAAYHHASVLAPLHLINVTINETTSRSSRVVQRDRKGKSLSISPAGYVFTTRSPSDRAVAFSLFQGEQLPVSTWMGISGAAFSTGMGQLSSIGFSLLAGLSNLRLGYWWDSPFPGRISERRAVGQHQSAVAKFTPAPAGADDLVQSYLLREIRGAYEGTHSNRWYLTDGGHYENTAAYELVRRRLRFVVLCDNGADPSYAFADLVNLIRKIRIDFEAETEFVDADELDRLLGSGSAMRRTFGTLDQLGGEAHAEHRSGPYAALARIRYLGLGDVKAGTPPTTLLLVKPRIAGAETPDVLRYKSANIEFPQQPTTDQFFDEAQWESYYRLGQLLGDAVFAVSPPDAAPGWFRWLRRRPSWRPFDLEPLP
ncbi:patatin-like phospholipase family protein [Sphingomonas sp. RHCKR7]|uniref:patatin-like phospholipase family protein n=1 Tax=Sphingomonas folli TaxID=2862497 RepID=UPI001CA55DE3|nr:patatin-like phospholipase family protein [Sphingomonas folli]MBW6526576.1 patatin-like phospholipase family protein [Sphingomonas folli]